MQTPPPAELAAAIVRVHGEVAGAYTEQKILLRLSDDPTLAVRVIRLLPRRVARDVTDDVLAHRELARLTPARPLSAFHVGAAAAAGPTRNADSGRAGVRRASSRCASTSSVTSRATPRGSNRMTRVASL